MKTPTAKVKKRNPPPKQQWEKLFQQAVKEKFPLTKADCHFLTNLMMDLSITKPFPLFQTFQTTTGALRLTIMTSLWAAAQSICRSNYPKSTPTLPSHPKHTSASYKDAGCPTEIFPIQSPENSSEKSIQEQHFPAHSPNHKPKTTIISTKKALTGKGTA